MPCHNVPRAIPVIVVGNLQGTHARVGWPFIPLVRRTGRQLIVIRTLDSGDTVDAVSRGRNVSLQQRPRIIEICHKTGAHIP